MAQRQEEKQKQNNPIYDEFLREQNKQTLEEKKGELETKLDGAMERYLELKERYGEDNLMTKFQAQMINILIPVNEFCSVVLTMEEAVIMFDETIGTIDDALDMINGCFTHNNQKYTFMAGVKMRRNMRRYWKSWNRRIERIGSVYGSMMGNSGRLMKTIAKMSDSMNPKKKNKPGKGVGANGFSAEAQALLDKKIAARGAGTGADGKGAPASPSPAASPKTADSSGAPGVDDLV